MSENNSNSGGVMTVLVGFFLLSALIGSCSQSTTTTNYTSSPSPKNDYQDMRSRGHSEEDAVIFSILKQQGYSDYEALRATKASGEQ